MELIEVINSSLIIFFSFVSVTATFSYITYKLKDRSREKTIRNFAMQVENTPVTGVYPKMLSVGNAYKIPGEIKEKNSIRRLNIFKHYSLNLAEKMHKLTLISSK